ncbi:MAG: hypothetical protein JXM79_02865 [Sedimentisphaerales bacterium]|nr:hypothetical protein [Sedimentisphaerales bacterium]
MISGAGAKDTEVVNAGVKDNTEECEPLAPMNITLTLSLGLAGVMISIFAILFSEAKRGAFILSAVRL